jgi:raffinose/stachyose/melibiose transport system substrate-binding protein
MDARSVQPLTRQSAHSAEGSSVARYSRRFVLQGLVAALPVTLIACGQAAPAAKPAESKPAAPAKPAESKPAAAPAKPAEAAKPSGTVVTGAGIGGAQAAVPTATGQETNPMPFKAPKTKASSPVTLTFSQYVGFHVDVQKEIAEEYKAQGDPNVSLEITAFPGLNEQRTAVKAAMAAASPTPDIIAVEPGADTVDYLQNGGVLSFNKVFEEDKEFKDSFWPNAIQLLTINGQVVSVPAVTNTVVIYYNRKMFAENGVQVPETWDDLKKIGAVFNGKGIAPIVYPAGQDRNFPIFPFYTVAGGLKQDLKLRDADLGKLAWTSPEMMQVAEQTEEIVKSDLLAKGALGIKEPDAIGIFSTGKSAMFWGGQWMRTSIRAALPPDFDLAIFPFPALMAGGPKPVLSSTGITLTVNSKSKHPELAFEMIKAITGVRGKVTYSSRLGISPNGPISPEALAFQMSRLKDPLYPEFLKLQPTGTTRVIFTPPVQEALYQGWQAVIGGSKNAKAVMEDVEAASKKAGERKFTVG